jgi:hypothetical protein
LDHASFNITQASGPSIQASKQIRTNKNGYTKQKESFRRAYKRIGLVATVTGMKEMWKTELGLKRNSYQKVYIIKEIKEL